jgi:hypothetical protein
MADSDQELSYLTESEKAAHLEKVNKTIDAWSAQLSQEELLAWLDARIEDLHAEYSRCEQRLSELKAMRERIINKPPPSK